LKIGEWSFEGLQVGYGQAARSGMQQHLNNVRYILSTFQHKKTGTAHACLGSVIKY
jgi:hypothetical protein